MKKLVAIVVALTASLAMAATAQAAGETVVGTTKITPQKGPLYKEKAVPVNLEIRAEVTTPDSSPSVNPLKNTKITFPQGMTFNPNNRVTPPCTDAMLNAQSNLADPSGVVASCAKSVIGTGTSAIIIAKVNLPGALIGDPILVIFNAGTDNQGRPKMKIYGYSKFTNVGILMNGTLIGRVLDVAVPVLSNDSAVKYFQFDMPGPLLDRPDIDVRARGLDRNYVRATCPQSPYRTNSEFILGERTYPGGQPTTPDTLAVSPETTQPCNGLAGQPRLRAVVKGPRAVRRGARGAFRVTVINNGTATARGVRLTATGGGKANAGVIRPGARKTVVVRTRVTGRKGSSRVLTFTAKGSARATARARARVRVR